MQGIETGKERVKKICDVLRKETLEPAKKEAEEIVEKAKLQAEGLLAEAKKRADQIQGDARRDIEREKAIAHAALQQSAKQVVESLKQMIEEKLFNPELSRLITKQTQDPKVIADLIQAVVKAIDKEGMNADLSVLVPAAVPARSVNGFLATEILSRLKEKSVLASSMGGGIEVKMHKENITIDLSDATLKELVANYIRKDFREMLFG